MCGPGMVLGLIVVAILIAFAVLMTLWMGLPGLITASCLIAALILRVRQESQKIKKEMKNER